jgi:Ran GTPase-activating protein (RanGAP) involved in mRNA processing and transport
MPGVSPVKLRDEVEAARSGVTDGNAAAGVRRRQLVSHLCDELSLQARLDTQSMADWRALRAAIDPTAAIDRFLERIQQCGSRDEASYVPNVQLGDAVATAVEMARLLAAWPQGLEALAEHQSCSLEALAEGEKGLGAQVGVLYPLSGATLSLDGARGLAALLYLRTTLTHVNLERVKLPPAGLSTLALALPASITTLLLAGTDCAAKGADLSGVRALCDVIDAARGAAAGGDGGDGGGGGGGARLTTLSLARNALPDAAAPLIVRALQANTLTSLDLTGNRFGAAAIEQVSAAACASSALQSFGGVPVAALRTDEQGAELELSELEIGTLEAHVLSQLLPGAPALEFARLEGQPIPVRLLCGRLAPGSEPSEQVQAATAEAVGEVATSLTPKRKKGDVELRAIHLNHAMLADPSALVIGALVVLSTALIELELGYNSIKPEGAAWLARGVARSTSLQSLSLAWNRLGPDGLIALASAVSSCATLTSLNLDNNAVCGINDFGQGTYTDAGLTALAEALRRRPQLTALNLSNNALGGCNQRGVGPRTSRGVEVLATALAPATGVSDLTLDGNHLGCALVVALLDALRACTTLTSLRLADTQLTDGSAPGSTLPSARASLAMSHASAHPHPPPPPFPTGGAPGSTQALETIAQMLKAGRLRVLGLDGNKVGPAGAYLLAAALKAAKPGGALTDLLLDREGNDLDEEAEKLLSKAFGAHPDACLHLARSEPENERLQQKAELSVREYLRNSSLNGAGAAEPNGMPRTDASLSVMVADGSLDSKRRHSIPGLSPNGKRGEFTPKRPSPDKKPPAASPRSARAQ